LTERLHEKYKENLLDVPLAAYDRGVPGLSGRRDARVGEDMTDLERRVLAAMPSRLLEKVQALPPSVRALYRTILSGFVETGRPPDPEVLERVAAQSGVEPSAAFAELGHLDIVLTDPGGRLGVRVAYPFSTEPTPHRVAIDGGPTVYAMCAIDALGIPWMLRRSGVAISVEPETEAPIKVLLQDGQATWQPPSCTVLLGKAAACAHAASGFCPFINFFTSPRSARTWTARHPEVEVWHLDQDTALRLARRSFGDLLAVAAA
jgi:hypothetical protein